LSEETILSSEDKQQPGLDVPDRSNRKGFWDSSDDWGSFGSCQGQSWKSVDTRSENEKGSSGSGKLKSSFTWNRESCFPKSNNNIDQKVFFYVKTISR